MLMPNGSVLVVGGETGSNGPPEPTLELLPYGGNVIMLDYLRHTDPNNLYPFLMVLPSGHFFIGNYLSSTIGAQLLTSTRPGYYNEARILDPVTFNTVTVLPNMPSTVNNFLAGRTYPLEGSAVLLPQDAPYTDPLEILICSGSAPFGGIALDCCILIAPEAANPTWTLERMVRTCTRILSSPDDDYVLFKASKRVMPCMVTLPDG